MKVIKAVTITEEEYQEYSDLKDKTTPKKPLKEYVVDGTYYICPSCGYLIETYSNMHDKNYKRVVINTSCYCSKCGQKLDWSEEE